MGWALVGISTPSDDRTRAWKSVCWQPPGGLFRGSDSPQSVRLAANSLAEVTDTESVALVGGSLLAFEWVRTRAHPNKPPCQQTPFASIAPRGPTSRRGRPPGRARALPLPAGRPHESPLFTGFRDQPSPTRRTRTRSRGRGFFRPATPLLRAPGRDRHQALHASPGRLQSP
jgi:hypothetical protein